MSIVSDTADAAEALHVNTRATRASEATERVGSLYSRVKAHVSVNKLIAMPSGILFIGLLYRAFANRLKPIGFRRLSIMTALFAVQRAWAHFCKNTDPEKALNSKLQKWVVNRFTGTDAKRQRILFASFYLKLIATISTAGLLDRTFVAHVPTGLKTILRVAFVAGMGILNKKAWDAEDDLMSRSITASERLANRNLVNLEQIVTNTLEETHGQDATTTIMHRFIKATLEGDETVPTLTFKGFGRSFTITDPPGVTILNDIERRIGSYRNDNPLFNLDSVWIREHDETKYAALKVNFDTFVTRYNASNSREERGIMTFFAKIYHFKTPAGSLEDIKDFIHNHNKAELKRIYPDLTRQIDAIYSDTSTEQGKKINISSRTLNALLADFKKTLRASLRQGTLLPECQEQIALLKQIIKSSDHNSIQFLGNLNQITDYDSALRHGDALLPNPRTPTSTPAYAVGILTWAHAYRELPNASADPNIQSDIERLANALETANRVMALTTTNPYLQSLRGQVVDSMTPRKAKCQRRAKQAVTYVAAATAFAAYCALPEERAYLPMPAIAAVAAGAVYIVRDKVTSWIQAQIRQASDEGRGSVDRAIESGISQVKGFLDGYSFKANIDRAKGAITARLTDGQARVMGFFTPGTRPSSRRS